MAAAPELVRLDGADLTLVFALEKGGSADLAYLGQRLPDGENLDAIVASQTRGRHESQPDTPPVPGLLPERKGGWSGTPAVEVLTAGRHCETDFRLSGWTTTNQILEIEYQDGLSRLTIKHVWQVARGDVIRIHTAVLNGSDRAYQLARLSSASFPLPRRFSDISTFSGRWTREMQEASRAILPDGFVRETATGKPGFGGNFSILHDRATGEVLAVQLAWSGDCFTRIECDWQGNADGRAALQVGARTGPHEIQLAPGESFQTPEAVMAIASNRSVLAQRFHKFTRAQLLPQRNRWGTRKVHINSWDSLGFGLSEKNLIELCDQAATLGVERFILDDGWFMGRRDTKSSLGDWAVCPAIFPTGLKPLIERVRSNSMDFGIWVEPEMVSPDSELYRAHPDWCIHVAGAERRTMRGQLVLDLSRDEVSDHVFSQIDALLIDHDIAYLKWDHNRDLFPATSPYLQTDGFYRLLDRIRAAHPDVEIETCAEGGGRIDYGILQRTHRVWPSDNNDPIERLRIMRSWSQFLPLEVLGSHVGPSPNP
ncbi:MAG: alpha-galactosidase, partial [Erythrobacter sp.]